ncbi:CHASE domain-containing protein [Paucibacter sp. Y2R2-4]|uniref:CHASE domain-containing protein n=1 Tax=Paucibacter sp. Y2R2-4 TaxID=2893553 RepID=UPI0021E4E86F|nr:CHASE domain-containing protein [Paucibacter sp. Y2R2-4]MCV2349997.1 CHASE domain-containing protein [Paucibacter sp. Y2R2-4]
MLTRVTLALAGLLLLCEALNVYGLRPLLSQQDWALRLWSEVLLLVLPAVLYLAWRGERLARSSLGPGEGLAKAQTQTQTQTQAQAQTKPLRRARITLILGLLLTALLLHYQIANLRNIALVRFDRLAAGLEDDVRRRFEHPGYGMRSLAALHAANLSLRREEFANFVRANRPPIDFSAINSYGFIERVRRDELEDFIHSQRNTGVPDFAVQDAGENGDLYIIKFIEPLAYHRAALGRNLGAEPVRRAALELAYRSGQATLSGAVMLENKGESATGFLYLLPLHYVGAATQSEEQRIAATAGLIFVPLVMDNLMEGIGSGIQGLLDFELYDGPALEPAGLVYSLGQELQVSRAQTARSPDKDLRGHMFQARRNFFVGGRELSLRINSTDRFAELAIESRPILTSLGAAAMSLLAAAIVWLLSMGRARAELLAEDMTLDLRQAKAVAETALRDHRLMLETLNQHSLVSMADAQGRLIYANDEFCRVTGYTREELLGQNHRIVHVVDESRAALKEGSAILAQGRSWSGAIGFCNRQGQTFWVKLTVAPSLDSQGQVERFVAIQTDISTQKQLEATLALSNERFALALEGGSDGLWDRIDTQADAEWWSPQYYRLLGLEPGEVTASASQFEERLHPDDAARHAAALVAALQNEAPYDLEIRLYIRGCGYRWFRARAKVFFNTEGQHRRMAGSLQDVHELKMAEARMKERSEQLAAVFALSPDGLVSIGTEHTIRYVSPAFTQLTGLGADAVLDLEPNALLTMLQALSRAEGTKEDTDADEVLNLNALKQGPLSLTIRTPQHRVLSLSLHEGGTGEVTQVLLLRDVTHQHEVDRLKSEFLATAAHELRTPMVSIYGFTELLITRELAPERQKQMLERIYRQSQAMIDILNELLDLARIEARRGQDFELEDTDLRVLVQQALNDFRAPEGRDAATFEGDTAPLTVHVDAMKIQQVLRNLLSNAYKFSESGQIWVRLSQRTATPDSPALACMEVQDQGRGMTPEQLARVTERFYRADQSGTVLGTGLGMSIVKEIVSLHGGQLQLSSALGEGTTITVLLPLAVTLSGQSDSSALAGENPSV